MQTRRDAIRLGAGLLATLGAGAAGAQSQDYPNRTVTLVVPFPPGGGNDATARIMAERLTATLGQNVVVENRGGAGGITGTRYAAKAPADGYTLMLGHTGSIGINPTLYANSGIDPRKDFTALGLVAKMPLVLVVHPSVQANTVKELIALAQQNPGKINLGCSSKGTGSHMLAEMFMHTANAPMNLVPYKGTSQALNDLIGGHVQATFNVIPPTVGGIRSGQLRAIAVTSPQRAVLLPDVPTVAESGLPGFDVVLNYGLLAPAGTPKPIVDKINEAMRRSLADEALKKRIAADGGEVVSSTAEEYTAIVDRDETIWSALIKKLNLRID